MLYLALIASLAVGFYASTNSAVMVDCVFQTNQVHGGGSSGSSGTGTAGGAMGGAIALEGGSLTNLNCQFTGNLGSTPAFGGGENFVRGVASQGGALFNGGGNLMVSGGTFISNNVKGGDTGLNANCIAGPGQGGAIYNGGQMTVSASTFDLNSSTGGGPGGHPAEGQGGAIYNAGPANISQTLFSSNSVQGSPATVGQVAPAPTDGKGGAIYNGDSIAIVACTFSDNRAVGINAIITYPPVPPANGLGGGLFNSGLCHMTNNTLTANLAVGGSTSNTIGNNTNGADAFGGAVYNSTTGAVVSVNNTFAFNDAEGGTGLGNGTGYGGGIYAITNASVAQINIGLMLFNETGGGSLAGGRAPPLSQGRAGPALTATRCQAPPFAFRKSTATRS